MTAIFLCLLFSQRATIANFVAGAAAIFGVFLCKCVGLSGPAILIGAILGVLAGVIASRRFGNEVIGGAEDVVD
jgi:predicted branched-subunit amino acid permease